MAVVPRPNELIKVTFEDATFFYKPMSYADKKEVLRFTTIQGGEQAINLAEANEMLVRRCLRKVEGLTFSDGTAFTLTTDENGHLDDQSIDMLFNTQFQQKAVSAAWLLYNANTEIEGAKVEIVPGNL